MSGGSTERPAGSGFKNAGTPGVTTSGWLKKVATFEHMSVAALIASNERQGCRAGGPLRPERIDLLIGVAPLKDRRVPIMEDGGNLRG